MIGNGTVGFRPATALFPEATIFCRLGVTDVGAKIVNVSLGDVGMHNASIGNDDAAGRLACGTFSKERSHERGLARMTLAHDEKPRAAPKEHATNKRSLELSCLDRPSDAIFDSLLRLVVPAEVEPQLRQGSDGLGTVRDVGVRITVHSVVNG
jgi:hypothetical protein